MPAGQLVDQDVQPVLALSVSQPVALNVPVKHADVPVEQLPVHVFVLAPVHAPVLHTQPEKSDEDVEVVVGHVPAHTDTGPPLVLIAMSWKAPAAHAVQTMSDVAVPAAE